MEECDICLTKIKKRNKKRNQESKKHKYFLSNLIINKYIVRNDEIDKFKDILQSYYDKHKKRFDNFAVRIIWKKESQIVCEVKLPDEVIIEKRWRVLPNINRIPMNLIAPTKPHNVNKIPKILKRSCVDYLDIFCNFGNDFCDEKTIIFISDIEDISYLLYKEQPRSLLCRKIEKNLIEGEKSLEDLEDLEYNWLPNCLKMLKIKFNFIEDICYLINDCH